MYSSRRQAEKLEAGSYLGGIEVGTELSSENSKMEIAMAIVKS
jgi:hypothetical protein